MALVLSLAGCGGGETPTPPPPALPATTVPAALTVLKTKIVVQPNTTKKTREAFTSVGATSLVDEAGVWELRKAEKLVGTLQLVTLDPGRVDTRIAKDRSEIRSQILSSSATQLDVDGLPVWSTKDDDRVLYVWYGRQVLGVLQVRADLLDPEETVNRLVEPMIQAKDWPGLPLEDFEEEL
jgi:hypothetical protein